MSKHTFNKLPFLIKYVPGKNKTQQACYKVILRNGGMIVFIPERYKDQMYTKAIDNYPHPLRSVLEYYKTCQYLFFYNTICPWWI